MLLDLNRKISNLQTFVQKAQKDKKILDEIIQSISFDKARIKFNAAKILQLISQQNPKKLYPQMDFFIKLLNHKNNILKWNAIIIIAHLTQVDTKNKFEKIFQKFYNLMHEGNLVTAANVISHSGQIAQNKPRLANKITKEILKVEKVPLPTTECRNVLRGQAILLLINALAKLKIVKTKKLFSHLLKNNSKTTAYPPNARPRSFWGGGIERSEF